MQHPFLEFIEGDVLEYPFLAELMASCDAVLHLAAIVSVPVSINEPIYTFQVNTQGFLHVLQAAHVIEHAIRIVYASSAAVYGSVLNYLVEKIVWRVIKPYHLMHCKKSMQKIMRLCMNAYMA